MTQEQIEQLTEEEYSYFLAHGEPKRTRLTEIADNRADVLYDTNVPSFNHGDCFWIATLDSTTFADMTFGYKDALYMSTLV